MGKWQNDTMLDQALNWIKSNATKMIVCSAQPTTYSEAVNSYKLADVSITSADFTGPADGDASGRKLTVNAQNSVSIDATGSAQHIALVKDTSSLLLYVTTCTTQSLTAGGKVNIPAWDIELSDPQ